MAERKQEEVVVERSPNADLTLPTSAFAEADSEYAKLRQERRREILGAERYDEEQRELARKNEELSDLDSDVHPSDTSGGANTEAARAEFERVNPGVTDAAIAEFEETGRGPLNPNDALIESELPTTTAPVPVPTPSRPPVTPPADLSNATTSTANASIAPLTPLGSPTPTPPSSSSGSSE